MTRTPNYELLREAYAILGGIPTRAINLDLVVTKESGNLSCGTIACGIGWLAHHPKFQYLGLEYKKHNGLHYKGRFIGYSDAGSRVFGISYHEANALFRPAPSGKNVHHKNMLLNRIKKFLIAKGQPVNNPKMLRETK